MEPEALDLSQNAAEMRRGRAHLAAGRWEEAAACFERVAEAERGNVEALRAWGEALRGARRKREAVGVLRHARTLRPEDAELRCELGDAWQDLGHPKEALPEYREAARLEPGLARAWYGAGCAHLAEGDFAEAAECQRRALAIAPTWTEARHNLGSALFKLGRADEALEAFGAAAQGAAIKGEEAELPWTMRAVIVPGCPGAGNRTILEVRREWAARQMTQGRKASREEVTRRDTPEGRRLRVGYVSSFFQNDHWMKPVWCLVNRHDREALEVHLFSDAPATAIQHGYRERAEDRYHDISGLNNEAAAARIAEAKLDILVDLNGYSVPRRLGVYAHRPAPVVVGWFNLYATSGAECFDSLIGDDVVCPAAEEAFYTETLVRVSGTYLTFEVNYPVPTVTGPPVEASGVFTFGCLAPLYKITPLVMDAWGEILRQVPGSRLRLRCTALDREDVRRFVTGEMAKRGVAEERLGLEGRAEHRVFLETYGRIDVALDTFPYNGGTTTTEALWQGVPVVTFRGDRWVARTSESILRAGGLGRFVAADREDYVRMAVRLATEPGERAGLRELRRGMREQLRTSAACDGDGFAREMERAYRELAGR